MKTCETKKNLNGVDHVRLTLLISDTLTKRDDL